MCSYENSNKYEKNFGAGKPSGDDTGGWVGVMEGEAPCGRCDNVHCSSSSQLFMFFFIHQQRLGLADLIHNAN